jgi:hypothetical protein
MSLARVRSLVILGVLMLAAVIVVTWTIVSDDQRGETAAGRQCGPGEKPAATKVPNEKDVKLNVYNSTDRSGLAQETASKLKGVGFAVLSYKQDPTGSVIHNSAQIRFGRKAVGAAQLVRAYVPGSQLAYDPDREDATVDLVLGDKYSGIRGPTDVKQAEIELGEPSPPPGTC